MMDGQQGWFWVSESDGDDSDDGKDVRNEPPKKKLKGKGTKLGSTKGGKSKLAASPTPKAATQLAAADKSAGPSTAPGTSRPNSALPKAATTVHRATPSPRPLSKNRNPTSGVVSARASPVISERPKSKQRQIIEPIAGPSGMSTQTTGVVNNPNRPTTFRSSPLKQPIPRKEVSFTIDPTSSRKRTQPLIVTSIVGRRTVDNTQVDCNTHTNSLIDQPHTSTAVESGIVPPAIPSCSSSAFRPITPNTNAEVEALTAGLGQTGPIQASGPQTPLNTDSNRLLVGTPLHLANAVNNLADAEDRTWCILGNVRRTLLATPAAQRRVLLPTPSPVVSRPPSAVPQWYNTNYVGSILSSTERSGSQSSGYVSRPSSQASHRTTPRPPTEH